MNGLVVLPQVELVPIIAVPAGVLSSEQPLLSEAGPDVSQTEDGDWPDALAELEVSMRCSIDRLTDPLVLNRFVVAALGDRLATAPHRGEATNESPDTTFTVDVESGFALCCGQEVLVEPSCCADLGNLAYWREAAAYRGEEWQMVWIGHPWLSVRFQEGWLILSQPHESEPPLARWAVRPEELESAVVRAQAELEAFARRLQPAFEALGASDPATVARNLAGLVC
jgi:hypothetical protein